MGSGFWLHVASETDFPRNSLSYFFYKFGDSQYPPPPQLKVGIFNHHLSKPELARASKTGLDNDRHITSIS